jgi:hypothetical protein
MGGEILFSGHYCQQRQIEYTRYTYTNNISYKTRRGFIATTIKFPSAIDTVGPQKLGRPGAE